MGRLVPDLDQIGRPGKHAVQGQHVTLRAAPGVDRSHRTNGVAAVALEHVDGRQASGPTVRDRVVPVRRGRPLEEAIAIGLPERWSAAPGLVRSHEVRARGVRPVVEVRTGPHDRRGGGTRVVHRRRRQCGEVAGSRTRRRCGGEQSDLQQIGAAGRRVEVDACVLTARVVVELQTRRAAITTRVSGDGRVQQRPAARLELVLPRRRSGEDEERVPRHQIRNRAERAGSELRTGRRRGQIEGIGTHTGKHHRRRAVVAALC